MKDITRTVVLGLSVGLPIAAVLYGTLGLEVGSARAKGPRSGTVEAKPHPALRIESPKGSYTTHKCASQTADFQFELEIPGAGLTKHKGKVVVTGLSLSAMTVMEEYLTKTFYMQCEYTTTIGTMTVQKTVSESLPKDLRCFQVSDFQAGCWSK